MTEIITNAVEEVFDKLIECTAQKDVAGAVALYDDSELFKFIDDERNVLKYPQLVELYTGLFNRLDYVEVLESTVSYEQLSHDAVLCFWSGKELIKMKDKDEVESSWSATVILKQFNEKWKIIHFHLIHF